MTALTVPFCASPSGRLDAASEPGKGSTLFARRGIGDLENTEAEQRGGGRVSHEQGRS